MAALKIFAIFLAVFCLCTRGLYVTRHQGVNNNNNNNNNKNNNNNNDNNNNNNNIFDEMKRIEESQLKTEGYVASAARTIDSGAVCLSHSKREDSKPIECPEADSRDVLHKDCQLELVQEVRASVLIARDRTRNILTSESYMSYNKMCERRPFKTETEVLSSHDPCTALTMMEQVIAVATAIVRLNKEEVSSSNIPRANYTQSFLLGIIKGDPENCFCASFIKLSMLGQSWSCSQQLDSRSLDFAESSSGSEMSAEVGITSFSQEECLQLYEIDSLLTRIGSTLEHISL